VSGIEKPTFRPAQKAPPKTKRQYTLDQYVLGHTYDETENYLDWDLRTRGKLADCPNRIS
jgi:hypothetical protein